MSEWRGDISSCSCMDHYSCDFHRLEGAVYRLEEANEDLKKTCQALIKRVEELEKENLKREEREFFIGKY